MKKIFGTISICLTLLALIFGAPGTTATYAAAAADPLTAQKTSPEGLLNPDGTLKVDVSFQGALDLDGWNVQIDPQRGPVFAPQVAASGEWANLGAGLNGPVNSGVLAVAVSGTDVYVGGNFVNVTNNGVALPAADKIVKWDGSNWSALGSNGAGDGSLNGIVNAIAVSGTNVYVGGNFYNVNNNGTALPAADYIAKWNGSVWSALGSNGAGDGSLNNYVFTIAVSGTNVYAGGLFTNVTNNGNVLTAADYIAKWNGSAWSSLGSNGAGNGSINQSVRAIAIDGTNVYVGGNFINVNNNGTVLTAADLIAKWNGSAWSALGSNGTGDGALRRGSLDRGVYAIAISGTNVYVGGYFTDVNNNGTVLPAADFIAKWNGSAWSALGSNGAGDGSFDDDSSFGRGVYALAVSGTNVYVGGIFKNVNNNGTVLSAADYVARWNGSTWSALGSNGAGDGSINWMVSALAVSGTNLYIGGPFGDVNNKGTILLTADYIAKWNGSAWSALGPGGRVDGAIDYTIYAVAVSGTDVYVGGWFTNVKQNGTPLPAADYIVKWNGSVWSALGSNGAGDGSLNSAVNAIAVSGTNVYVGGAFTNVNNNGTSLQKADYIAKWNGSAWSALGSNGAGNGSLNNSVYAIAVSGANIYVGGEFTDVNNNGMLLRKADYIAKWNGSAWSALGSNGAVNGSINNFVHAIAISGTNVYVGGYFTDVNNNGTVLPAADYIAKWNGSAWSALGSNGAGNGSLNRWVETLAVSGTDVYVGGWFENVNNNGKFLAAGDYIAKWNGSAWSALGSNGAGNGSLNDVIFAVAVSGANVYVGGYYLANVNNNGTVLTAADHIARWNGSAWSALGSNGAGDGSLNGAVFAIAVSGTDLYAGGMFTNVKSNGKVIPAADYIAVYGLGAAPTATPTATSTWTKTRTPTPTGTSTVTPTIPATPTVTGTVTPTPTMDASPTATTTPSPVVTMTETSTETMTVTPTETPTETMTPTPTIEITPTFTITPTATAT